MAIDFQQIRQQIKQLGEQAPLRLEKLNQLRTQAEKLLSQNALNQDYLRDKVTRAAHLVPNLRCAVPTNEAFTEPNPLPPPPAATTIIAADGSQINPDRHQEVDYFLVNVGAIQMQYSQPEAPITSIFSQLSAQDAMYTENGLISEAMVALLRDQLEREVLADLSEKTKGSVITFTDGPVELWGRVELQTQLFDKYLAALSRLHKRGAAVAGYVDRPRSDLVVRLLELSVLDDANIGEAGKERWLLGITDISLFAAFLQPGQRSALFGIQSKTAASYTEELALHFFYLNVSQEEDDPYLVRVEVPSWVAIQPDLLDSLHAILFEQCHIVAGSRYPYLLHRAHETAVVTREEKQQLEAMIALDLRQRGIKVGGRSAKQTAKDYSRM